MVKSVEYKNPARLDLIRELERVYSENGSNIWSKVVDELSRVRRNRREVNVYKIGKHTQDGDFVVVPGKVLGDGRINHKVNVAAFGFSDGAKRKIVDAGGKTMTIMELAKSNPKGSKIKLMG